MGLNMNPDICSVIACLVWVRLKWKIQSDPVHGFLACYSIAIGTVDFQSLLEGELFCLWLLHRLLADCQVEFCSLLKFYPYCEKSYQFFLFCEVITGLSGTLLCWTCGGQMGS